MDKFKQLIHNLIDELLLNKTGRSRRLALMLSVVTVFVTTYMLILPALTLVKDRAAEMGGIDVPVTAEDEHAAGDDASPEEDEADDKADSGESHDADADDENDGGKADESGTNGGDANAGSSHEGGQANGDQTGSAQASDSQMGDAEGNGADPAKGQDGNALLFEGENYKIEVTDKNSTLPGDTRVEVEEILEDDKDQAKEYKSLYKDALKAVREDSSADIDDFKFARFYNISLLSGEDEVRLKDAVDVTISYEKALQKQLKITDPDKVRIIHFAEDKKTGEITPEILDSKKVDVTVNKTKLAETTFEAEGFSVYAVVGENETGDNARATVNFYGKNTVEPLATVYVKNSDTADDLVDIVFDPGCGDLSSANKEMFDGWIISTVNTTDGTSYTIETEGKTIEDVRAYLEALEIHEGDVVNIYAKIVRTITIKYQGEDENTVLGSDIVKVLASDGPNTVADYTINMNYTPMTATQAFMGWNVDSGASNIVSATYENEAVETPYQNGTTISVKGDVVLSVNAPYGHWIVFDENGKGATYNAPQFIEEGEITTEPSGNMVRLGYTFGGWYTDKDCTDGNEFTFGNELTDNVTVYAKWTPAQTANYTVIVWKEKMSDTYEQNGGTGDGKKKNYDFAESYTFSGTVGTNAAAVSNGTSSVVDGDDNGTSYYNARIQGKDVNSNTNINNTVSYTGYHCAGYDTEVEITPEGNTVVNVYYDRNTVTYTFHTYGSSDTDGTWYLCEEDGTHIIKDGEYANSDTGITTSTSSNARPYTGQVSKNDGRTYYYSTTGACGGTAMREAHWEQSTSGSQWNVYQKSTGLYGEQLNWPTDTSIWWYENHNNTQGYGTRMTYKDAFLPLNADMTVDYWGNKASASGTIHFWTQNVDGTTYTDAVQVNTGNANFYINDKFTGFYAYQYRTDNGSWRNVGNLNESTGIYGDSVSYNNRLDIRYNRMKAAITFMDGSYFDGNGNALDEEPQAEEFYTTPEYYYEADVSSYNKNGSNYYKPPDKEGYTFAGWYADDACTVLYDFDTMPLTGITVYAKWIQNQYRVFLHPNVPESDTTLNWGSDYQGMNFRVSTGEKVSTPTGTRTGYKFIGWYLDEGCTEIFDADKFVLNDTTVNTPYDKTVDMTDEMNKYGNIVGTGSNSDLTGYNGGERFWITKKMDLYAKWREELIGADGIGVRYDANGGTNPPSDTTLYLDNTDTVAQGASTAPDDTQQFLYWVLQKWDETTGTYADLPGEENRFYPGDTFTVLKANSQIEELEGSTEENPKYRYTVQLRAEYGPKDEPTPTHLTWYANGGISADGTVDRYIVPTLQINQAVDIRAANTFKREGYEFIGWARIDSTTEGYEISEKDLSEDDLFLKYEDGKFYAQITDGSDEWTEVTKIAADENHPYHDLYAVWKEKKYTVTVKKTVNGITGDDEIPFSFTPSFTDMTGSDYTSAFQLVGKEGGADIEGDDGTVHYDQEKTFVEVPYGTIFSITEQANDTFDVICKVKVTNSDNEDNNKTTSGVINGTELTANGDVELTVINTRKLQKLRIVKTDLNDNPLGGAEFTVNVDGTDYTFTSDAADGVLKNELFTDGVLVVPHGTYELTEVTAPAGYNSLESPVIIRVDKEGIHVDGFDVSEPEDGRDYYILSIPNNPGVTLPSTGGDGTEIIYLAGIILILVSVTGFLLRKKIKF